MTSAPAAGILAIWNDCREGSEGEYEAWYRGEHLRERVGLAGFRFGRRYLRVDGTGPRYFTYYETASVDVLFSPTYLERGANPTPMTRHIMTSVFRNMSRTVCSRARTAGDITGPCAVTVRAAAKELPALEAAWGELSDLPDRLRAELWRSAEKADDKPSVEESIRGKDAKIAGCLLATFSDPEHAATAAAAIRRRLGEGPVVGHYRLSCALDHQDIAP